MLKPFVDNIWATEHELTVAGFPINTRMTVIRLSGGNIILHSPVPKLKGLVQELERLGPIGAVIAPNRLHHLYCSDWSENKLFLAPGLTKKREDLKAYQTLGNQAPVEWTNEIDQHLVGGMPEFNEVVFYHRPSKTLIVSDLLFNIQEARSWRSKFLFKFLGNYKKLNVSKILISRIKDKKAFTSSLREILKWDFENLIMAHGTPIQEQARSQVERVLRSKGFI